MWGTLFKYQSGKKCLIFKGAASPDPIKQSSEPWKMGLPLNSMHIKTPMMPFEFQVNVMVFKNINDNQMLATLLILPTHCLYLFLMPHNAKGVNIWILDLNLFIWVWNTFAYFMFILIAGMCSRGIPRILALRKEGNAFRKWERWGRDSQIGKKKICREGN